MLCYAILLGTRVLVVGGGNPRIFGWEACNSLEEAKNQLTSSSEVGVPVCVLDRGLITFLESGHL